MGENRIPWPGGGTRWGGLNCHPWLWSAGLGNGEGGGGGGGGKDRI